MTSELAGRVALLALAALVPLYVFTSAATRVPALAVPVEGVLLSELQDSFDTPREGRRRHGAIDIEAPDGTHVLAATGGRVRRLSTSPRGGIAIYVVDRGRLECHYYGHLSGYAPELEEGQAIERGSHLGYVGSTGNARETSAHLHFAVFPLRADGRCDFGEPRNPYPLLTER